MECTPLPSYRPSGVSSAQRKSHLLLGICARGGRSCEAVRSAHWASVGGAATPASPVQSPVQSPAGHPTPLPLCNDFRWPNSLSSMSRCRPLHCDRCQFLPRVAVGLGGMETPISFRPWNKTGTQPHSWRGQSGWRARCGRGTTGMGGKQE